MAVVRVMLLRAAGTNCDLEAQHAWEQAGARVERVHIRELLARPAKLDECQVLTIPGGFSYGDDIAAGRIFAAQLEDGLDERIRAFVERGRLVLGICNGFQVLVKAGLLPFSKNTAGSAPSKRVCTITCNEPPGFQDRWVTLRADGDRCAFLEPGRCYEMPIAHGEGRVLFANAAAQKQVVSGGHVALRYAPPGPDSGHPPDSPHNPNGSADDIAGLCDETGRILGLMPHPERFVTATQHPLWTRRPPIDEGDGMAIFRRAVAAVR